MTLVSTHKWPFMFGSAFSAGFRLWHTGRLPLERDRSMMAHISFQPTETCA